MKTIKDFLTTQQIKELTELSDWEGAKSVAVSWSIIFAAFGLVAWETNPLTIGIALVLLGGRQLALAILMHEASHRSLFATRSYNDVIGKWLCAAPVWQHLDAYRTHHLAHHAHTGSAKDTDISLVRGLPTDRAGILRKILRDISGITGLKRIVGLLAMEFGFVKYTAASDVTKNDQSEKTTGEIIQQGLTNLFPVVITNLALYLTLAAAGVGWLYALWVIAYLTTFSLFIRIRSIAEHAMLPAQDPNNLKIDQLAVTRTTAANIAARLTVAPHYVNYHVEHHTLPTVPHYNLPRMHHILRHNGAFAYSNYASGYMPVLREAMTG